ncbi:MAG: VIT1/CCC1 transporter family protein [Nitrosopumilus sp. (ex Thoosa mismalolli)]|nr:VIT1/CCC1 transporter family protein [Nitrosopumilus sp. (ex Thoosa mismalolli)]
MVAGVVGAGLLPGIILILGFANLFVDGFAMATANFQSIKAKNEFIQMKRKQEEAEIENDQLSEMYPN